MKTKSCHNMSGSLPFSLASVCRPMGLALALLILPATSRATLLGHWTFDEGSGTTATDSSGRGNNGTLAGSPIPVWVAPGAVGSGALDFTPTARVSLPNNPDFQITSSLTLSAWTWSDAATSGRIITKGTGTRGWELNTESNGRYGILIPVNSSTLVGCYTSPGTVPLGVWVHVAGVYNQSDPLLGNVPSIKLYTNGLLAATVTASVPATMYNNTGIAPSIGTRPDGNNRWDGKLDQVRVYNEALSQAEIQALPELVQNPLAFTYEPVGVTVEENQSVTFSNSFSGSPSLFVQWFENNSPISGAIYQTYTIPVVPLTMDGYQYSVSISNFLYGIVSSNATLHVIADATKPIVVSVQARGPTDQVIVTFSEAVSQATAETTSNYSVTNAVGTVFGVTGATLAADNATVTLTLASPMTEGADYVLVVDNIQDRAVTPQTILPGTTAPFTYNSLRALWRFEENTGTTTADSSGNGLTGTLTGTPMPAWVADHYSGVSALDFDNGSSGTSRVLVNNDPLLQLTGPMTLSAWVTLDVNRGGAIVTKGGASGNRGWRLGTDTASGGVWTLEVASSPTALVTLQVPGVLSNLWTHVAGVYDPSDQSMKLYVNGMLATTGVGPAAQTDSGLGVGIGARWGDGSVRWDGKIDDVRIHGRALTEAEIRALPELAQTPLSWVRQPSSVTVPANSSVTFSNAVSGSPPHFIQWLSNSVPIPGANHPTYTIPIAVGSMNGDMYSVIVSNLAYSLTSTNATLNVNTDTTKPAVVSVLAFGDPTQVIVTFSEPILLATAQDIGNYAITNAVGGVVNVSMATLGADSLTVTLLTDTLFDGTNYSLVLNNIQDMALIPNTILPGTTVPFTYSSLVGCWKFEEGSGTTTADSGPGGFTGTLLNGPTWVAGQIGQYALNFDGANDRVDVGDPPALQLAGPMTLAAWAWPASISDNGRIVTKGGGGGSRGWALNVESADLWRLQIAVDANNLVSCGSSGVALNTWTHVAGVYDPNDPGGPIMKFYTNGVLAATETTGVPYVQYNSGMNVSIGSRASGDTRWNGKIDEVRIYARALTDTEIAALAAPPLRFLPPVLVNNELILNWTGQGQLQSAPAVTGVYTNITPAPNPPYTNAIVPAQNQFFRLLATP